MLEWLIVGGGVHGVHHALMLRMRGVPADRCKAGRQAYPWLEEA
jgi:hypothetical protein